jgi:hypothetical protein
VGDLIEIRRMPHADAKRLLEQVSELDSRIFRHRSDAVKDAFYASMRDPTAGEKFVVLYEGYGVPVGFNLIKINPVEVGSRTIWAVGSIAGFLPGHTGGNRTFPDAIRAMLRVKARHPEREFYFVSMLINPGGYDLLVQLCPETYPSPSHPRSESGFEPALIAATARTAGAEVIRDDPVGFVVSVGRAARDTFDHRRETANTRFFEALNPGYAEGELLGVCAPLNAGTLARGAARLLTRRLRKRLAGKRRPA